MTKRRAPRTIDAALTRIADALPGGWPEMAEITRRREGLVRSWGDPDRREEIPVRDALMLDKACRAIGGGTPIGEYYVGRLDAEGALAPADGPALARHAALTVKECGEAIAALISAAQPGATARLVADARLQVEEALETLFRALPMLVGRDAFDKIVDSPDPEHQTGPPRAH